MDEQIVQTKKPRPKYEWAVLGAAFVAAIVIAFGIYTKRDAAQKGKLLISELSNIRSAVTTYKMLNKVNPPSIDDLSKLNYSFEPGEAAKPYLNKVKTNTKGEAIDPFGNPYKYDAQTGWVVSITKGFEKW